jgi:hypothetical protein
MPALICKGPSHLSWFGYSSSVMLFSMTLFATQLKRALAGEGACGTGAPRRIVRLAIDGRAETADAVVRPASRAL